jgi:hypothetical protein
MSFPAKYAGTCQGECGEPIEPGEDIQYAEDWGFRHVDCAPAPERVDGPVCPDCFLIHPEGVCDA